MRTGAPRQGKFRVKRLSRRVRGTVRRDQDTRWKTRCPRRMASHGRSHAARGVSAENRRRESRGKTQVHIPGGPVAARIICEGRAGSCWQRDPFQRGLYGACGQVHFHRGTHGRQNREAGLAGLVPPPAWYRLRFEYMGARTGHRRGQPTGAA